MLLHSGKKSYDDSEDSEDDVSGAEVENDTGLPLHMVGGDMSLSLSESLEEDNPRHYSYTVQILKEETDEPEVVSPSGTRRESDRVKAQKENGLASPHEDEEDKEWAGKRVKVGVDSKM